MRHAIILLVLIAFLGCERQVSSNSQSQPAKKYTLQGVVLEVHKDKRELRIKHEDIPGYMRGMTMNFPVRDDDQALGTLAAGDEIAAELNVAAPGDYWVANIRKTAPGKPSQ